MNNQEKQTIRLYEQGQRFYKKFCYPKNYDLKNEVVRISKKEFEEEFKNQSPIKFEGDLKKYNKYFFNSEKGKRVLEYYN